MIVKEQDNTFVDNFLTKAVDIMSKKYRPAVDKAAFSIIPKKIKPVSIQKICFLKFNDSHNPYGLTLKHTKF